MLHADFIVAVGDGQQRAGAMDAPAEVFQQVERRLVRPVHVLENDDRRFPVDLIERGGKGGIPVSRPIDRREQRPLGLPRNVV